MNEKEYYASEFIFSDHSRRELIPAVSEWLDLCSCAYFVDGPCLPFLFHIISVV